MYPFSAAGDFGGGSREQKEESTETWSWMRPLIDRRLLLLRPCGPRSSRSSLQLLVNGSLAWLGVNFCHKLRLMVDKKGCIPLYSSPRPGGVPAANGFHQVSPSVLAMEALAGGGLKYAQVARETTSLVVDLHQREFNSSSSQYDQWNRSFL